MTVKELIDQLKCMPLDLEVMLSRDGEGNGYGNVSDVELSSKNDENEPCHPDDADDTRGQCVVIWPDAAPIKGNIMPPITPEASKFYDKAEEVLSRLYARW